MLSAALRSLDTNRSRETLQRTPLSAYLELTTATFCNVVLLTKSTLVVRNSGVTTVKNRKVHSLYARLVGTDTSFGPPGANFADP